MSPCKGIESRIKLSHRKHEAKINPHLIKYAEKQSHEEDAFHQAGQPRIFGLEMTQLDTSHKTQEARTASLSSMGTANLEDMKPQLMSQLSRPCPERAAEATISLAKYERWQTYHAVIRRFNMALDVVHVNTIKTSPKKLDSNKGNIEADNTDLSLSIDQRYISSQDFAEHWEREAMAHVKNPNGKVWMYPRHQPTNLPTIPTEPRWIPRRIIW